MMYQAIVSHTRIHMHVYSPISFSAVRPCFRTVQTVADRRTFVWPSVHKNHSTGVLQHVSVCMLNYCSAGFLCVFFFWSAHVEHDVIFIRVRKHHKNHNNSTSSTSKQRQQHLKQTQIQLHPNFQYRGLLGVQHRRCCVYIKSIARRSQVRSVGIVFFGVPICCCLLMRACVCV